MKLTIQAGIWILLATVPVGMAPAQEAIVQQPCHGCEVQAEFDYRLAAPCAGCSYHRYCYWKMYDKRPMLTDWLYSPCDMIPHHAYFPIAHENYYFRPYHPQDLVKQRLEASNWNGNPRNPYDDDVFLQARESLFPTEELPTPGELPSVEGLDQE